MSFRLFVYYCALCGGWAALFGWVLGNWLSPTDPLMRPGVLGLFLGMLVALALSLVDSIWILGARQPLKIMGRVGVAVAVGSLGGFAGGLVGQLLLSATHSSIFFIAGWVLTGLLVGVSIGTYEVLASIIQGRAGAGPRKKLIKSLLGGTVGGVLGGGLALLLRLAASYVFRDKDEELLVSPTVMGFVAVGVCIGLLVGLAQVLFREAWIKVEAGFRPGREMILAKDIITIGRAESCDIGLFGDAQIEKQHASIVLSERRYFLEDSDTPGGTFVNDRRVEGRVPLQSGDLIRVGKSILRFGEREKRADAAAVG